MLSPYQVRKLLLRQKPVTVNNGAVTAKPDVFETTLKLLPLISLILVCLGYFNLHTYYRFFSISIYNYLDISEIIFSFVSIVDEVFEYFLSGILYIVAFVAIKHFAILRRYEEGLTWTKRFYAKPAKIVLFSIGLILYIYLLIRGYFYDKLNLGGIENWIINWVGSNIGPTFYFLVLIIPGIIIFFLSTVESNKTTLTNSTIFILVCAFAVFILLRSYVYSYHIKNGIPIKQIELSCRDGKEIKSTKTWLFIGSTKNYYFFSNKDTHKNMIIPLSEVIEERSISSKSQK